MEINAPADAPGKSGPSVAGTQPPSETRSRRRSSWGDFFAFRVMITPTLIRIVYAVGVGLITVGAILIPLQTTPLTVCQGPVGGAATCASSGSNLVYAFLIAIIGFLVLQVVWRVITELVMVIFGIHESVRSIEAQGR
jgi:hypothetical protein